MASQFLPTLLCSALWYWGEPCNHFPTACWHHIKLCRRRVLWRDAGGQRRFSSFFWIFLLLFWLLGLLATPHGAYPHASFRATPTGGSSSYCQHHSQLLAHLPGTQLEDCQQISPDGQLSSAFPLQKLFSKFRLHPRRELLSKSSPQPSRWLTACQTWPETPQRTSARPLGHSHTLSIKVWISALGDGRVGSSSKFVPSLGTFSPIVYGCSVYLLVLYPLEFCLPFKLIHCYQ